SDFSVGGGVGLDHITGGGGPNRTAVLFEPGVRARAFITSNVAVHAVLGLSISVTIRTTTGTTTAASGWALRACSGTASRTTSTRGAASGRLRKGPRTSASALHGLI